MTKTASNGLRLLQWNVLADGLGHDGFIVNEFMPDGFLEQVRHAKQQDEARLQELNRIRKLLNKIPQDEQTQQQQRQELQALLDQESALGEVQRQHGDAPKLRQVDEHVLQWDKRFPRIKEIILATDPDVITFQEMDRLHQFLNDPDFSREYTCMVSKKNNRDYVPPRYHDTNPELDDLAQANYMDHLLKVGAAFAPKAYSLARKLKMKRPCPTNSADIAVLEDDGVAIYWKRDKFIAKELAFLHSPQQHSKAFVAVVLQDRRSRQAYNVVTAHLPSGDSKQREEQRLLMLEDVSCTWEARCLCQQPDKTFCEKRFDEQFRGLEDFVQHFARCEGITILGMDSNSRPLFPPVEPKHTNVWKEMQKSGLQSAWVLSNYLQPNGHVTESYRETPYVASVNKMRGPASEQLDKIGQHKVELIDHVFTNAPHCQIQTAVNVNEKRILLSPQVYRDKASAESSLIPSVAMPSDHSPVLITIGGSVASF